jgi:hypothetical protein
LYNSARGCRNKQLNKRIKVAKETNGEDSLEYKQVVEESVAYKAKDKTIETKLATAKKELEDPNTTDKRKDELKKIIDKCMSQISSPTVYTHNTTLQTLIYFNLQLLN